jgi:acyl carrier protein
MTRPELLTILKSLIAEETGIEVSDINETDTFFNLGLDSISCIYLLDKLEKKLSVELNPIHFWDYPSLDTYTDFLLQEMNAHGK